MEHLKKLEQQHMMLNLLQSECLISPNNSADSHRFLSHFLLFLKEPCGNLSIDDKCNIISNHLPKISPTLIEKALVLLPGEKKGFVSGTPPVDQIEEESGGGGVSHGSGLVGDMALIGLDAMQRANSTLEDFCRSYFMFHQMDVRRPECIFKYLPVLSFTESYIYQLDILNEKMVKATKSKASIPDGRSDKKAYSTWPFKFIENFESDPFRPITLLLEHYGLLTHRIREELQCGLKYWSLERKLCGAPEQTEISVEDVMNAIRLKSFDYRVLNLLLYQLQGEEVNDLHMEFLTVSEFLVEISDDLFDYEEDVLENNFNILRMFMRIYGASEAPTMLAKCIAEAEYKYEELSKSLDPKLYMSYRTRCEEATKEGGKISEHPLGSWTIPPLIVDEELYRSTMQNSP